MQTLQLQDGSNLSYKIEGQGTPILFIHAPGIGYVNFFRQMPLATQYQVIMPDLRGHGDSSPSTQPFTLADVAKDLRQLIQHVTEQEPGQKVILCGYSHGGSIALECMLQCPELIAGSILVSSFSEVNDLYMHSRFYMAQSMAAIHGVPWINRSVASSHLDEKLEKEHWVLHGKKTDAYTLEQLYAAGHIYNCTSRLKEIQTPTLLVYGEEDTPMHPYGKILMKGIPYAEIVYVPRVKHQVVTKTADVFNKLCDDFITALTRQKVEILQ